MEDIKDILIDAIAEVNEELGIEELKDIQNDTPLFTLLDSMAVLDLILEIEDRLQQKYGKYIQIADDKSMDPLNTPFKTFQTLLEYVQERVDG